LKDVSQEEFLARYEAYVKELGTASGARDGVIKEDEKSDRENHHEVAAKDKAADGDQRGRKPSFSFHGNEATFLNIVLKFTTLSEGCVEAPSFTVGKTGAVIGRDKSNEISVPSDLRLASERHATIENHNGHFYIIDGGQTFSASIRIGVGSSHNKKWVMDKDARFSCGNSIFVSRGHNSNDELEIYALEGPLKGDLFKIPKRGATFGRSSENHVSVPDKELSRKHSKIEYDEKLGRFVVSDMGSTNGTYVQLVGPYGGRYKLNLNDHILVGRTGFSINRFDYGISEEMGYRPAMEDACAIVQHLNIGPLSLQDLSPQSFFGVFDGHGGVSASHYLAQHLHVNVAHALLGVSNDVFRVFTSSNAICDEETAVSRLDAIIVKAMKECFLKADQDFISSSAFPQHGSTATTALVLGKRLYCCNVGDSRTLLCRLCLFLEVHLKNVI
jgi:pSer/pThr/pTyr-binding forkhead associated (FHA) protein